MSSKYTIKGKWVIFEKKDLFKIAVRLEHVVSINFISDKQSKVRFLNGETFTVELPFEKALKEFGKTNLIDN